jgi:hypothetical protein
MALENIFAGASDAATSKYAKLPKLRSIQTSDGWKTRCCSALLTLRRLEAFTAEQSGQDFVSAEFYVNQVWDGGEFAHAEGTLVKAMWCLDRKRSGDLTYRGMAEMRRVRGFFEAMFSQAGIAVTNENIAKLMAVSVKGAMGEKADAADAKMLGIKKGDDYPSPLGTQVVVRIYEEASKSDKPEHAGKVYPTEQWSAPPSEEVPF